MDLHQGMDVGQDPDLGEILGKLLWFLILQLHVYSLFHTFKKL
jgi:hypothetical protein